VALDAKIVTTVRVIDAEEFFAAGVQASTILDDGELVKEVVLPKPDPAVKSIYLKYRHRKAIDFPLFSVAVVLRMNGNHVESARIALGGAAPVPMRAKAAEDMVAGKDLTESLAAAAAAEAFKDALPMRENGYKVSAARAYVRRAIAAIIDK
jgi:CO/xanthine dehydrogenase FAD-binding subunit